MTRLRSSVQLAASTAASHGIRVGITRQPKGRSILKSESGMRRCGSGKDCGYRGTIVRNVKLIRGVVTFFDFGMQ